MLMAYPPAGIEVVTVDTKRFMEWVNVLKKECAR